MQKVINLSENKQQWIIAVLSALGVSQKDIERVLTTKWWSFCENNDELKDAIKELWDIEFESDKELYEYIFSGRNKDIITLPASNPSSCYSYVIWSERTYKSSGAEIKTGAEFDSLEDLYNHLGKSYRKRISCNMFLNFCFVYGNVGCVLVHDNGHRTFMEFLIRKDKTVAIMHIGELKDGYDSSIENFIEALRDV